MDEIAPIIQWIKTSAGNSSLTGWLIVVTQLWALWKYLPAIMDSRTKRFVAEQERAQKEREENRAELARLHQLHMDCEERVRLITESNDKRLAAAFSQIDELRCDLGKAQQQIAGLTAAKAQAQVSTAHLLAGALPEGRAVRLEELAAQASAAMSKDKL